MADADIMQDYTPFGHADDQGTIARITKFAAEGKKTAVGSTIKTACAAVSTTCRRAARSSAG